MFEALQKGCEPAKADGTTYSCTSNTWSLNDQALTQIDKVTYYLGGAYTARSVGAELWYSYERGTIVSFNRLKSWNGYIGVLYPSDYLYTFANGVDNTCFSNGNNCSSGILTSSWMYNIFDTDAQWLLNPVLSDDIFQVFGLYNGDVFYETRLLGSNSVMQRWSAFPTLYLKDFVIIEGSGSIDDVYRVVN